MTVINVGLIAMALTALYTQDDTVDAIRFIIRLTARTSLILFLFAFVASGAFRLSPSPATAWLRANRRYFGLAFAWSHLMHLAAIFALMEIAPTIFMKLTNIVAYIGGGIAYGFILMMVATSFHWTAKWIGVAAWTWIHKVGMWYIWASFVLNFGKRIPMSALYIAPVTLLVIAGVIRVFASFRKSALA